LSDRVVAGVIAAVVLASRIPFASQTLWAWDSVLYARALEQGFHVGTDLGDQRPHPPGYFFYVGLAAIVRLVTRDSNAALVIISVVASALTAGAVYLVARRYGDRALAVLVALGSASAPLVWTYGEIAMPYALLGLLSIAFAIALRDGRARAWPAALVTSAALGLAAGLRQDLMLLLGPLWLWMLWARPWRERALCVAALGVASLAWFVPSAVLSGGFVEYVGSLSGQAARVSELSPAAGGNALVLNTLLTVYALFWGLLGFAVLLITAVLAALTVRRGLSEDAIFFALWLIPAALVYVTIHIGDPGYLMSMLPGLYVACAALLAPIARRAPAPVITTAALAVAIGVVVFAIGDTQFSPSAIVRHDRVLQQRVATVRAQSPSTFVVLARSQYLLARYYLPEYRVLFEGAAPEVLSSKAQAVRLGSPLTFFYFGDEMSADSFTPAGMTLTAYELEPR
jgi:hypothetical protein